MALRNFGDKFGSAALKGVQGYFNGVRIFNEREDRNQRKLDNQRARQDREVARTRGNEAYNYKLSRRPIREEVENNQLEKSRMDMRKLKEEDEFNKTVRKDGAAALRGFMAGNTDVVGDFYNNYIDDGKTGTFVQDKDGSYRHEFVDDSTGEAGTEVFSKDQMQGVLQRAATSDDDFIAQLKAISVATAAAKAKRADEDYKQKGRIELQGLKNKGNSDSANGGSKFYDVNINTPNGPVKKTFSNSEADKLYKRKYGFPEDSMMMSDPEKYDELSLAASRNAPPYENFLSDLITNGLTPSEFPKDGGLYPWQVDAAKIPDSQKPATEKKQTLPKRALAKLKEGGVTQFSNGQAWTLKNGKAVRVK